MTTEPLGFLNAKPFFEIVMEGLKGHVTGDSFWEVIAENAVFEFCYDIPGFTNKFESRALYMDWFKTYGMKLDSADNLHIYQVTEKNIIVLEYQVHGTAPSTNKIYHNKFCSIITIEDEKVVYWKDYMDTLAVMLAAQ